MDIVAQAALAHLQTVLTGYLPAPSAASIDRNLLILPRKIKPLGIGGYVGMHDNPHAEVFGRFVEADAEIRVSESNQDLATINSEIGGVLNSLLTTDRETLRTDGIYKLHLASLSPPDTDNRNARVATFAIDYEFQQLPGDAGGTIDTIDIRDLLNPANGRAEFIVNIDASSLAALADPLQDFQPLTDTDINQNSASANWVYNSAALRIEQLNNVRGGGLTAATARKAGAQLLVRPGGVVTPLQHLVVGVDTSTDSGEGIGCVFRWQDIDNFYFFLISQSNNYQMFGKKLNGAWSFMDGGGLSGLTTLDLSARQRLQVFALHNRFQAYLDGRLICEASDDSLAGAGEAGFLAHGNNAAYLHAVDLVKLNN